MTHTFGVTSSDPFGIATEHFILKGLSPSIEYNTPIADDAAGEYVSASQKSVGGKQSIAATYGSVVITEVGAIEIATAGEAAAVALESVTISTSKGNHATGSASGHSHIDGTGTNHNGTTRIITIPTFAGFGASLFGLSVGVPESSIQSSSYTVELGHTDDDDKDGNFLCGTCHGEKHTATFEAVDETAWTVPEGWVLASKTPDSSSIEVNNAHMRRVASFVKFVNGPTLSEP